MDSDAPLVLISKLNLDFLPSMAIYYIVQWCENSRLRDLESAIELLQTELKLARVNG